MDFETWEPVYDAILADFGYDRVADERARDDLAEALSGTPSSMDALDVGGSVVAVAGAGPSLADEVDRARSADAVFAASTAADRLGEAGVAVDLVVTDLDKHADRLGEFAAEGTPVALHAHGDNREALRRVVPTLPAGAVLPTTQAAPIEPVVNPGGFTDGDRAAFLADELGADRLVFPGWDFDDPSVDAAKARKLEWAERLLYWLETRREERFDVLDGRRADVEVAALPLDG